MAITPPGLGTITAQDPFNDFLDPVKAKWEAETPESDPNKRAVIAFSAGNYNITVGGGPANRGITASGLYGLLRIAQASNLNAVTLFPNLSGTNPSAFDVTSESFVYDNPTVFVNHLNRIHNNINNVIRQFIPPATWNALDENGLEEAPQSNISTTNAFNFVNNIFFPGVYTGNPSTAQLPELSGLGLEGRQDYTGNGITGAFTNLDTVNREYYLSRTGMEFYTVLTALAYGAKVVVSGNYNSLASFAPPVNVMTSVDAFITLDMSTYLDGQGITSAASDSRLVYGGSENSYALGNTFNFCHGLTAQWLNSIYTEITKRNNLVNSSLDNDAPVATKSAYIIHAGLSGAAISIAQNSLDNTFNDVYRYPGFDGQPSLYQNVLNTAGLTAYTLSEEPYLNRLMCVMGKKRLDINTPNFGHPSTKTLRIEIPLVADVAGSIQRAKANNSIYQSSVGLGNSIVLNVDSITPTINSNSSQATLLRERRVNFYVQATGGKYILSTDLVGATSPSGLIGIEDRVGVTSMKRVITKLTQDILDNFVASNVPNNEGTRTEIVNTIKNAIDLNDGLRTSLITGTQVVVNQVTTNNTLISVTVTFYPKQASFGTSLPGDSNLVGYSLTVTASTV